MNMETMLIKDTRNGLIFEVDNFEVENFLECFDAPDKLIVLEGL